MVSRGDALRCPICDVILMKKWGCDWVRCSMCKNEVCWVTAQPRWGPGVSTSLVYMCCMLCILLLCILPTRVY